MSGLVGSTALTAGEVEVGSRSREVIEMGRGEDEVGDGDPRLQADELL
ncbi:MAG: hypothetical protein M3M97_06285 [Actinomycetota bacterium]|nr:hypothetical protein [Actinomycetota bacterium]